MGTFFVNILNSQEIRLGNLISITDKVKDDVKDLQKLNYEQLINKGDFTFIDSTLIQSNLVAHFYSLINDSQLCNDKQKLNQLKYLFEQGIADAADILGECYLSAGMLDESIIYLLKASPYVARSGMRMVVNKNKLFRNFKINSEALAFQSLELGSFAAYQYLLKSNKKVEELLRILECNDTSLSRRTLGYIFFNGVGVDINAEKSLNFYEKDLAVNTSSITAFNIAKIYDELLNDDKSALKYYELAFKLGDCDAGNILGLKKSSLTILKNAYDCGSLDAGFNFAMLELEANSDNGIEYLSNISKKGYHKASFNLGGFYLKGKYVDKDSSIAVDFFKIAASQGSEKAKEILQKLRK